MELPPGVTRLSALPMFIMLNKADAVKVRRGPQVGQLRPPAHPFSPAVAAARQASIQFSRDAGRVGPRARGGPEDVAELVCARLRELAIGRACLGHLIPSPQVAVLPSRTASLSLPLTPRDVGRLRRVLVCDE